MGEGLGLFSAHIERFNAGVRTGDWAPMVDGFTEDAELVFEGLSGDVIRGPIRGRRQIAAAYRNQPPDDVIEVLDVFEPDEDLVVATYAWGRAAGTRSGELHLTRRGERIARLVITSDASAAS